MRPATPEDVTKTITAINADWCTIWTDSDQPWSAWAGECGLFCHYVWESLRDQGLEVCSDSFDNGLTCITRLQPPPGISLQELLDLGIDEHLNHVWIVAGGRHFDAAHPNGVDTPWDLRVVRQAMVESLQLLRPDVTSKLCLDVPWWTESKRLLDDFLVMINARDPQVSLQTSVGSPSQAEAPARQDGASKPGRPRSR